MPITNGVALINMPFGTLLTPSIGLGLLKAGLNRVGIPAKVFYFTTRFAELIGERVYRKVYDETYTHDLVGEWIFSNSLFQHQSDRDVKRYVEDILRGQAFRNLEDYFSLEPISESLIIDILAIRSEVERFLQECVRALVSFRPSVIGFTSLFQQHVASLALARQLKAQLPSTFIVFGGSNCEGPMGRETLRQFAFVDAVVSGEGEVAFPELVQRVLANKPVARMEGVISRQPSGHPVLVDGPLRNTLTIENLDTLPIPDYDDYFDQLAASSLHSSVKPTLLFETSRGCWWGAKHHCTFCGLNGATMAYRSKSAKRALDELKYLTNKHPGYVVNVVDNILDHNYFKDFIPILAQRKLGLTLYYEVKANLKKDQIRLLREAGISGIQPGIESLSDQVLRIMRKGVGALQNVQLLKWCKELGVKPDWNLIWGFPGESAEEYDRMVRFLPLLVHLPPPRAAGRIRLDRFSPNFDQAEQLGFKSLRPYPAYYHVYPLPDAAVANLAYYFTFEYQVPQDTARYAKPLVQAFRSWSVCHPQSELFWLEKENQLLIWDWRPFALEPFTLLKGYRKFAYMACDQIRTASQVFELWSQDAGPPIGLAEISQALEEFTAKRLMFKEGDSYLSLAIPKSLARES